MYYGEVGTYINDMCNNLYSADSNELRNTYYINIRTIISAIKRQQTTQKEKKEQTYIGTFIQYRTRSSNFN